MRETERVSKRERQRVSKRERDRESEQERERETENELKRERERERERERVGERWVRTIFYAPPKKNELLIQSRKVNKLLNTQGETLINTLSVCLSLSLCISP